MSLLVMILFWLKGALNEQSKYFSIDNYLIGKVKRIQKF